MTCTSRFLTYFGFCLIAFGLVSCSGDSYPEEGYFETESGFFRSYFPYPPAAEVEYGHDSTLVREALLLAKDGDFAKSGHLLLYGDIQRNRYEPIPPEVFSSFEFNSADVGRTFEHNPTGLEGYKVERGRSEGTLLVEERKNLTIYSFGQDDSIDSLTLKDRSLSGVTVEFIFNIEPQVELESGWELIRKYDNYSDTLNFTEMKTSYMDSTLGVYSLVFNAKNCFPKELIIDTRGAQIGGNFIYTSELSIKLEEGANESRPPLGKMFFNRAAMSFLWDVYQN